MLVYRTTGISDIHMHIFLAECILPGSLDCTARQCWPIGQVWSVLYISTQLLSIFHWSPFKRNIYRNGPKQAKLQNQTGLAAMHSCNSWFSPVKRISILCCGTVLNIFVYVWLVLGVFLLFFLSIHYAHTV